MSFIEGLVKRGFMNRYQFWAGFTAMWGIGMLLLDIATALTTIELMYAMPYVFLAAAPVFAVLALVLSSRTLYGSGAATACGAVSGAGAVDVLFIGLGSMSPLATVIVAVLNIYAAALIYRFGKEYDHKTRSTPDAA